MRRFIEIGFHAVTWFIWKRKSAINWRERMEYARILFPGHFQWSPMRATADVLATVNQHLIYYTNPEAGAKKIHEVGLVRAYETKLIYILRDQLLKGEFSVGEAKEVLDMLTEYKEVQSEVYSEIYDVLAKHCM